MTRHSKKKYLLKAPYGTTLDNLTLVVPPHGWKFRTNLAFPGFRPTFPFMHVDYFDNTFILVKPTSLPS